MKNKRTVEGRGAVICGETESFATYRLSLTSDQLGNKKLAGSLQNVDPAVAFMAARTGTCRLILQDGQEIVVHVSHCDDRGNVQVESSGPIPVI